MPRRQMGALVCGGWRVAMDSFKCPSRSLYQLKLLRKSQLAIVPFLSTHKTPLATLLVASQISITHNIGGERK